MRKTLTQLEAELVKERKNASKNGMFGLDECKKSIKFWLEMSKKYDKKPLTLEKYYTELIYRGLTEVGFNITMIVACEQMIEELN